MGESPRGVCYFFWSSGSCKRGFECTFKHQLKPDVTEPSDSVTLSDPDFFSTEGLAENNHSPRSTIYTIKPAEAHNHIQSFLRDNYMFDLAFRVDGFVRIFASINGRNKAWVRCSAYPAVFLLIICP